MTDLTRRATQIIRSSGKDAFTAPQQAIPILAMIAAHMEQQTKLLEEIAASVRKPEQP